MPFYTNHNEQEDPFRIITHAIIKKKLPHALLFTGSEGIGKSFYAKQLAMICNCSDIQTGNNDLNIFPCYECRSCRKIQSKNHPDVLYVEPTGMNILIDQVRSIRSMLQMRPFEAKTRVIIINHAEKMNSEAANALLKILEEPPNQTLLILIAPDKEDLLETITSRCQQIRFWPIPSHELMETLIQKYRLSIDTAHAIAELAEGSLTEAEIYCTPKQLKERQWLIQELYHIKDWSYGHLLAISKKIANHKDSLPLYLCIINSWLRDLIFYQYCPEKLINKDYIPFIHNYKKLSSKQFLLQIDAVQLCQKQMLRANRNLVVEVMLMRIYQLNQ